MSEHPLPPAPQSELLTLSTIVERGWRFRVPIYQRLYVWGRDQVRTLMTDLLAACERGEPIYYLGGTLVMDREGDRGGRDCVLELIDGQQRFTTLWLIARVWGAGHEELGRFLQVSRGDRLLPRLEFAIRDSVNRYLDGCVQATGAPVADSAEDARGLQSILDAENEIRSFLDSRDRRVGLEQFGRFLLDRVRLVQTRVPAHTDLNKLFEVINNRGVQLQHHDILKARMLALLDEAERASYARLWEACAGMNGYVEKNLAQLVAAGAGSDRLRVTSLFDNAASEDGAEALASASRVLEFLRRVEAPQPGQAETLSLEAILRSPPAEARHPAPSTPQDSPAGNEDEPGAVRSIFGFPVLLQHVLRVWLFRKDREDLDRIADKDLLAIFEQRFFGASAGAEEARSFIALLWELRYLFDKHIVKWVNDGEEEVHRIRKLRLVTSNNSTSLLRDRDEPEALKAFSLLQSMLYHSQQITTQYWVTPLLAFLHGEPCASPARRTAFLRHLDNHLLCAGDERPLVQRSRDFIAEPWLSRAALRCDVLAEQRLGVAFPHYWFYKLEYVLWSAYSDATAANALPASSHITSETLAQFRITARNSVEHVFPQNPPPGRERTVGEEWLDAFGNLMLVSRSVNSEFGNKSYEEKRARFRDMSRLRLDSLKGALIYAHERWDDQKLLAHQEAVIALLQRHLDTDWQQRAAVAAGANG
ncbi:DUF262 domain-containing protein [Caldimonas tepidiphila]|uniref:DUF262 domain-containing protein n=1 Tax=Caldimonas tepidiphila TaxID=2315841 RepID=UPI000E5A64BD|nr:DUF262 domain-containing protein [Caldimonas tepidiphila]